MPKQTTGEKWQEECSDHETARRRDAVLKRMLETPPRPHKEDVGKSERKRRNNKK